ncbi:hypothetical protein BD311DRAFT_763562 [Dichomitus squalens]|uniref:Uncharacterized protein n=1 Tax=Dichomitus squalens TaxID=114155 RepID=A0A4Q9MGL3_9APHY|nr:hypothetical protein BD311DRAFT_763562 [Dichomitus squalens]
MVCVLSVRLMPRRPAAGFCYRNTGTSASGWGYKKARRVRLPHRLEQKDPLGGLRGPKSEEAAALTTCTHVPLDRLAKQLERVSRCAGVVTRGATAVMANHRYVASHTTCSPPFPPLVSLSGWPSRAWRSSHTAGVQISMNHLMYDFSASSLVTER